MALLDDPAPGTVLKDVRFQTTVTLMAVTRHGADSMKSI